MKRISLLGVSFIEFLITAAIILILAAIAIPSYQNYMRRTYYKDIAQLVEPYRIAVGECAHNLGTLTGCDAGTNGIPAALTTPNGPVASLSVVSGVITTIPVPARGIKDADTYILTPELAGNGVVSWTASGDAVTKDYIK